MLKRAQETFNRVSRDLSYLWLVVFKRNAEMLKLFVRSVLDALDNKNYSL